MIPHPRLGYRVPPPSPLRRMFERAGVRLAPMNRSLPHQGHHCGSCPRCGSFGALFLSPDERTFSLTCSCMPGGEFDEFDAFLLLYGRRSRVA